MANPSFAIVDDDTNFCSLAAEIASEYGFQARGMHSVGEAKRWLRDHSPDLMLLDVRLPDGSGYEVLDTLTPRHRGKVVMVSGSADASEIARAVSSHASDYWLKPLPASKLLELLRSVASSYSDQQARVPDSMGLVGTSPPMTRLRADIRRAAGSAVHVMLFGEAGTGKATVARALHAASGAKGAFVTVNCCQAQHNSDFGLQALVEAYERSRAGTLLLQDIDLLASGLQREFASFIRGLQSDTTDPNAFTRIVAATGEPMEAAAGVIYPGLFYRLYEHGIHLPPLRERGHDLDLLARHFLEQHNARSGQDRALARIADHVRSYPWPGNVRELANAVAQAYSSREEGEVQLRVTRGAQKPTVAMEAIAPASESTSKALAHAQDAVVIPVGTRMREVEQIMLEATLKHCNGDKTAASRVLGVSTRTIHNWVRRRPDDAAHS